LQQKGKNKLFPRIRGRNQGCGTYFYEVILNKNPVNILMSGITIISATNRPGSFTSKMAKGYQQLLESRDISTELLSLEQLPRDIAFSEVFGNRSPEFTKLIERYIDNTDKFVFIVPEYNGSFPGILKVMLDAIPPKHWTDKKAALIGVSQGRAGNLRGIEQLTLILNYLKIHVYHNKLPVSVVDKLLDEKGTITNADTIEVLNRHIDGFLKF
jgi:chromate reductase, NAD(P)H dehydrogenase (quinone)